MKTITKRELIQMTAQVLADVDSGQSVVVTERGIARWRIEAIGDSADPVGRLRTQGSITPPKAHPMPWPDEDTHRDPARVDLLYADSRGDH